MLKTKKNEDHVSQNCCKLADIDVGMTESGERQLKRKFADLESKYTPFLWNFRDTQVITPRASSSARTINNTKLPGEASLNI